MEVKVISQPKDHEGKHRDPLNRRRKPYEQATPEVLGVDIIDKIVTEEDKKNAKS